MGRSARMLLGIVTVAMGVAPLILWASIRLDARTLDGLRVHGERLPRTHDPAALLEERGDAWLAEHVGVRAGHRVELRTRRQLGARVQVARVSRAALDWGRTGGPLRGLGEWLDASRGRVDLDWETHVDASAAGSYVAALDAELASVPGGPRLAVRSARAALLTALRRGEILVDLPLRTAPGRPAPEPAAATGPPVVLGTYATRFARAGRERNRAHNVRRAAELLDGAVIPAGGLFSFNARVGARTLERGFRVAPEIFDGEMVDGVGGGTCQVASTLHASAFLAGLDIVDHAPHSRPASYIPLGLDATVTWPDGDLQLRNPLAHAVTVRATVEDGRLRVEVIGPGPAPHVTWRRSVLSRSDFEERIVEDPLMPEGAREVTQEGIPGYVVRRVRTTLRGGLGRDESALLTYPPTDRIVRIGTAGKPPAFAFAPGDAGWASPARPSPP